MSVIALTIAAAMALAGAEEPLVPSSAWNIDYAENNCTLARSFGTGDDLITLGLMPQTGGGRMKIVLLAKNPKRFASGRGRAVLTLGGGEKVEDDYYSLLDPRLGRVALVTSNRKSLAALGTAKTLTVTLGGTTLTFAIPQMAAALKALEGCETDLAKSWGFDPALVAVKPVPVNPQAWLRNEDYPKGALFTETSGITEFQLNIDAKGKTTACRVTQTSGAAELDARTCEIMMKRSKFEPARDKDGNAIPSIWASAVSWTAGDGSSRRR